ncbi:MAG: hypothetical protein KC800_33765 [Candidatus Eremiobacteraeota bacterium]|nr:hypothetical protein [Candidatus Eremiobacteraeota bacterium]
MLLNPNIGQLTYGPAFAPIRLPEKSAPTVAEVAAAPKETMALSNENGREAFLTKFEIQATKKAAREIAATDQAGSRKEMQVLMGGICLSASIVALAALPLAPAAALIVGVTTLGAYIGDRMVMNPEIAQNESKILKHFGKQNETESMEWVIAEAPKTAAKMSQKFTGA